MADFVTEIREYREIPMAWVGPEGRLDIRMQKSFVLPVVSIVSREFAIRRKEECVIAEDCAQAQLYAEAAAQLNDGEVCLIAEYMGAKSILAILDPRVEPDRPFNFVRVPGIFSELDFAIITYRLGEYDGVSRIEPQLQVKYIDRYTSRHYCYCSETDAWYDIKNKKDYEINLLTALNKKDQSEKRRTWS